LTAYIVSTGEFARIDMAHEKIFEPAHVLRVSRCERNIAPQEKTMKRMLSLAFVLGLVTAGIARAQDAATDSAHTKKTVTDQRAAKARRQAIQDLRTRGSNIPAAFSGAQQSGR
jgi:hypothetical protein